MRLMGKRQLGELQPEELVSTILISNLASISIESEDVPITASLIPLFLIAALELLGSVVSFRSQKFFNFLSGRPKTVILDGKIDETFLDNMYKALNYEADLTNARELGKASVMNQKVIAQKEVTKGDGLPNISASGDEVKTTPKKKGYIETLKEQSY